MNRNLLFYKLKKAGLHGRVIDTLQNLYSKTRYRLKHNSKLSPPITQNIGVNQGGNASPLLFRKYMADLVKYLHKHTGVCISQDILMHLLWADDLILVSSTLAGLQKQLDGLHQFCANNQMIVNELKTKFMVFGMEEHVQLTFKGKDIEQVNEYKYLGNIFNAVSRATGDTFRSNHEYLCTKARQAIFSLQKKARHAGTLPPQCLIYLYQSLVQPILLYGSEVWGANAKAAASIDKILLWYLRIILHVKATTSNLITIGECGVIPPSVLSHISVLTYFIRLRHMPDTSITKVVFDEMERLHGLGFETWYTRVWKLAESYNIDLHDTEINDNKKVIKQRLVNCFKDRWRHQIHDTTNNPILRTYCRIKEDFHIEKYLVAVKNPKYRIAIAKIRASSHTLEVERGRYTNPKTPLTDRVCTVCNEVEDEEHFLVNCSRYTDERLELTNKILSAHSGYNTLNSQEKFLFLMKNQDPRILSWTGKFIHKCFLKYNIKT